MNDNDAVSGDAAICRCCGRYKPLHPQSRTTCQFCVDECTNEGCIDTYLVDESPAARFERERRERTKAWITTCRTQLGKDQP